MGGWLWNPGFGSPQEMPAVKGSYHRSHDCCYLSSIGRDTFGSHTAGKSSAGKTNLDEPVQNHLAHLLLITEGQLLLGHEDAIATVELEVCPPAKLERTRQVYQGGVSSCSRLCCPHPHPHRGHGRACSGDPLCVITKTT